MMIGSLLRITAVGALLTVSNLAEAQVMLRAPPPGQTEFPACCKWCPPSGCTECNSGPEGLSCGPGLIKAECSMTDNKVSCKKAESRPAGGGSGALTAPQ